MSQPKCVKYTYFDFHTETKGDVRLFKGFNFIEFPSLEWSHDKDWRHASEEVSLLYWR